MTWAVRRPAATEGKNRIRLLTMTRLPTDDDNRLDWQRARAQMFDYRRRITEAGYRIEWSWSVEQNPKRSGYHAHAIQWGDFIPQRELSSMWGDRRVDIRAIGRPGAETYAIKEAIVTAGYTVKNGTESFDRLGEHLVINGGRVCHFSRGFLHGLKSAEAMTALRQELNKGVTHQWHFEPVLRDGAARLAFARYVDRHGREAVFA
jgi:hypothetical protein